MRIYVTSIVNRFVDITNQMEELVCCSGSWFLKLRMSSRYALENIVGEEFCISDCSMHIDVIVDLSQRYLVPNTIKVLELFILRGFIHVDIGFSFSLVLFFKVKCVKFLNTEYYYISKHKLSPFQVWKTMLFFANQHPGVLVFVCLIKFLYTTNCRLILMADIIAMIWRNWERMTPGWFWLQIRG